MYQQHSFACLLLIFSCFFLGCESTVTQTELGPSPSLEPVTDLYYAAVPGSSNKMYVTQIVRQDVGTVMVNRSLENRDPTKELHTYHLDQGAFLSNGPDGMEVVTDGTYWLLPFNPGQPARQIGGGTIKVDCECSNGPSGCNFSVRTSDDGCVNIRCSPRHGDCTGNCDATLTSSVYTSLNEPAMVIKATSMILN